MTDHFDEAQQLLAGLYETADPPGVPGAVMTAARALTVARAQAHATLAVAAAAIAASCIQAGAVPMSEAISLLRSYGVVDDNGVVTPGGP